MWPRFNMAAMGHTCLTLPPRPWFVVVRIVFHRGSSSAPGSPASPRALTASVCVDPPCRAAHSIVFRAFFSTQKNGQAGPRPVGRVELCGRGRGGVPRVAVRQRRAAPHRLRWARPGEAGEGPRGMRARQRRGQGSTCAVERGREGRARVGEKGGKKGEGGREGRGRRATVGEKGAAEGFPPECC